MKETAKEYKRGISLYLNGDVERAFDTLKESFYKRLIKGEHDSKEFKAFYDYYLASYFAQKGSMAVSLQEGDMVSDLILSTYLDIDEYCNKSPFRITQEGRLSLLENANLVFPAEDSSVLEEMESIKEEINKGK